MLGDSESEKEEAKLIEIEKVLPNMVLGKLITLS